MSERVAWWRRDIGDRRGRVSLEGDGFVVVRPRGLWRPEVVRVRWDAVREVWAENLALLCVMLWFEREGEERLLAVDSTTEGWEELVRAASEHLEGFNAVNFRLAEWPGYTTLCWRRGEAVADFAPEAEGAVSAAAKARKEGESRVRGWFYAGHWIVVSIACAVWISGGLLPWDPVGLLWVGVLLLMGLVAGAIGRTLWFWGLGDLFLWRPLDSLGWSDPRLFGAGLLAGLFDAVVVAGVGWSMWQLREGTPMEQWPFVDDRVFQTAWVVFMVVSLGITILGVRTILRRLLRRRAGEAEKEATV